ncbi:MAG: efflux RND transporter permease subunit [Xanthomonadaceae bacterium]|nr:efflux RND transporter permease subunit [Xanthomonadaceae bacterium]
MNSIIKYSIENKYTVLVLTLLMALAGVAVFQVLPIDAVPDITNVQVQVNTRAVGLVPEELERNITFPLEASMRGIAGVKQIRSITRFGISQVTVIFEEGSDIFRARQMVSERLQGVTLPLYAKPQLGPITTGLGEIYHYTIDYEKVETDPSLRLKQLQDLRALQDWYVKPRLLSVPGIAEVNTIGGYEKEYHIQPDPKKLAAYGLHFRDIQLAIQRVNRNVGGSYIQQTSEQFLVQGLGIFKTIEDIKNVPVKSLETLRTITIADVAQVVIGKELRNGAALVNGKEAILGTTLMLLGENSRKVATRVKEKVDKVNLELPAGVKITPLYNRSQLVNATLGTVEHNLATGAALVIVVLLLLVGNVRAAIVTAVTIPLTLLGTFIIMKPLGLSGNLISLGALDFGIIVDGTVIVLDNCVRFIHEKTHDIRRALTKEELKDAIYQATVEIRKAAGFGQIIILLIFLPVFALDGVAGKMFRPMAATFSIAVFVALIMSFTTAPALASILLQGNAEDKEPKLMIKIRDAYEKILNSCLKYKQVAVSIGVIGFILGAFLFSRLGGEFLPQLDEGSLAMELVRPVNTSIDQSIRMQEKVEKMIREYPEVEHVFSRMGTAQVATDPQGVNTADTYVVFHPREEWSKLKSQFKNKKELVASIAKRLDQEVPGQRFIMSQPIQMRFNELLEGTRSDVSVKVFGSNLDEIVRIAKEMRDIIKTIPGAGDVQVDLVGKSNLLKITPNSSMIQRMALSPDQILSTVGIAIGGEEAGSFYENERRFPIMVRLSEEQRTKIESLKKLPVQVSLNATMPLSKLSDIMFDETYGLILRENSERRTAVLINPRGRDTESFVHEAQKLVSERIKLPEGYSLEWGGDFKNLISARERLMVVTPVVLLLVILVIYMAFQNWFQTFLVFSCAPLALVGGVIGLMLKGLPFSISAGVGFVALTGIAVLNGVVLMNYFNDLKAKGKSGGDLVKEGTLIRLRPVLMTALVDVFGFLPMMLSTDVGAEVQQPLATVVIGGVISSTALTLLVLPTLYVMFEKRM